MLDDVNPPFPYRSGLASVDLTATFAWHGRKQGLDRLADSEALDSWFAGSAAGPADHASTAEELDAARRLRAAIYELCSVSVFGREASAHAIDTLNEFAAEPHSTPRLVADSAGFSSVRTVTVRDQLGHLARETVELLSGEYATKVRECTSPPCWVLFVDRSRSNNRKWCSLHCGQKSTAANYRQRVKQKQLENA